MSYEKSLVLLKPDAVRRRLIGRIIDRFEQTGLEILQMKMVQKATEQLISDHYQSTPTWLLGVGTKTINSYQKAGRGLEDVEQDFGSSEAMEIGKIVKDRLIRFMTGGPLVAMVIGGNHAIKKIRALAGYTIPTEAAPGTIRADYSCDSPDLATSENRSVENLVHASGNREEADYEIRLWFGDDQL